MFANSINNYTNTCTALSKAIADLDVRIRVSAQNQNLIDSYTTKVRKLEENVSITKEMLDELRPLLNDIQDYIAKKRTSSMQNINNALRIAGEIIPDSGEGIYFKLDGDEAWLSTADGLEVDATEGGGYRQISSTFIRSVVLDSNRDKLKTLMLDEIFSLVSQENSAKLSLYLNIICQDNQVISIEQKPQVYSNIDNLTYVFNKDNDFAEVSMRLIKRSDIGGKDASKVT